MTKIAEAFVEISADTRPLERNTELGLERTRKRLGDFDRFVSRWARRIGVGLAAASVASVKLAADAAEVENRFQAVFGSQSRDAEKFARLLSSKVGRSISEIRKGMSDFQAMFSGLGFETGQARQFSESITQLAIDFGSFNNLSDDEAIGRFVSALSGSGEVLDRFGINIKQAALDQKLLEMGFQKSTQGATEQQKVMARLQIIMEGMGRQGAIGDAEKTADSFSNQLKRLRSNVIDLATAFGGALLGGTGGEGGIKAVNNALEHMKDELVDPLSRSFVELKNTAVDAFDTIANKASAEVYSGSAKVSGGAGASAFALNTELQLARLWGLYLAGEGAKFSDRALFGIGIGPNPSGPGGGFFEGAVNAVRHATQGPAESTADALLGTAREFNENAAHARAESKIRQARSDAAASRADRSYSRLGQQMMLLANANKQFANGQLGAPNFGAGALGSGRGNPGTGILRFGNFIGGLGQLIPKPDQVQAVTQSISTAIGGFTTSSGSPQVREIKKTNDILGDIWDYLRDYQAGEVFV